MVRCELTKHTRKKEKIIKKEGNEKMLDKISLWLEIEDMQKHEMLAHLYGISETDAQAYFHILEENIMTLKELTEKLGKDRTTAQKTIKKLVENGLVHRRKINLTKGGIKYSYEAVPFSLVKEKMIEKVNAWQSVAINKINDIM